MRQIRLILRGLLTLILCLCFAGISLGAEMEQAQTTIMLLPSDRDNQAITILPAVGETFYVDIATSDNTEGIYGIQLLLSFNSEYLEPMSSQLLPSSVWDGQYIAKNMVDPNQGKAYFVASLLGPKAGLTDQQTLARLEFKVKKATQNPVLISVEAGNQTQGTAVSNSTGQEISWQAQNISLSGNELSNPTEGDSGGNHDSNSGGGAQAMTTEKLIIGKEDVQSLVKDNQLVITPNNRQLSMPNEAVQLLLTSTSTNAWPLQVVSEQGTVLINRQALAKVTDLNLYLGPTASMQLPQYGQSFGKSLQLVSNLSGQVRLSVDVTPDELTTASSKFWGIWFQGETEAQFRPCSLKDTSEGGQVMEGLMPSNFAATKMVYRRSFKDIERHWARPQMEYLAYLGVIQGQEQGLLLPEQKVTRAEFASMLVRAIGLIPNAEQQESAGFSDVPANAWYAQDVELAYGAGIISGMGSNHFAPQALITREQMAVMLANAYQYICKQELNTGSIEFKDSALVSKWARLAVQSCAARGFVSGNESSCFEPQVPATRAQATVMLYQLLNSEEVKHCLENNW